MKSVQKYVVPIAVVGVLALGSVAFFTVNVSADTATDPHASLIERLATKFNLSKGDVETVFEENRSERQATRQAEQTKKIETSLTQAVADGKITAEQKQLILDKHTQMQAERKNSMDTWRAMTMEERQSTMEKRRTELEAWAKANNIDTQYLMMGSGPGMGHGGGKGMGHGGNGMHQGTAGATDSK